MQFGHGMRGLGLDWQAGCTYRGQNSGRLPMREVIPLKGTQRDPKNPRGTRKTACSDQLSLKKGPVPLILCKNRANLLTDTIWA